MPPKTKNVKAKSTHRKPDPTPIEGTEASEPTSEVMLLALTQALESVVEAASSGERVDKRRTPYPTNFATADEPTRARQ